MSEKTEVELPWPFNLDAKWTLQVVEEVLGEFPKWLRGAIYRRIGEKIIEANARQCTACGGKGRRFDEVTHDFIAARAGTPPMGSAIIKCPECSGLGVLIEQEG